MKAPGTKLADYLEADGWDLVQHHTEDVEWWADEIWQFKSRWSPEGTSAFVTFLVDPMWEGNRRKGQGVWAMGCSADFPRTPAEAQRGGTLRLNASKEEIERLVEAVSGFRRPHEKA